jgi:hypothetical protein
MPLKNTLSYAKKQHKKTTRVTVKNAVTGIAVEKKAVTWIKTHLLIKKPDNNIG